jgi:peptide/nickel transport system substrate-binding protein
MLSRLALLCFPLLAVGALAAYMRAMPHVLTISDGSDLVTLNPHLTQAGTTANLSEMTMAWLLRWDEHNQLYPELATTVPTRENGGISADGRTITYHLRHGVRWSDGSPFDASDVVFTTAVVNNPQNNETTRFDRVASVETPDRYTVIVHLKKPDSTFLAAFFSSCCANPPLLPKHLLAKYRTINDVPYNALPVGIGPFRFERWDRGKQVVLVANSLYWRGRPKLDMVIYKVVPDREALLAQMQSRQIDLWYQFSGTYLPRVASLSGITVYRHPSYAYNHFDFNLEHQVVSDVRVREALRFGLDRKQLIDELAYGVGTVQDSVTPLSAPYRVDIGATAYDPGRANALLDAAGWKRDSGGIREKDGKPLVLRLAISGGQSDTRAFVNRVAQEWRRIGVATNVQWYTAAKMFAPASQGGALYANSWDVIYFAWAADPNGDYSSEYGCKSFPPDGLNVLRWCNVKAQDAMEALFGHEQQDQRTQDVAVLVRALDVDVPTIVTAMREDLFAYNADLRNYRPNSLTPFDNMMSVDI